MAHYYLLVCDRCNEPIEDKEFAILDLTSIVERVLYFHISCVKLKGATYRGEPNPVFAYPPQEKLKKPWDTKLKGV